MQVTSKLWPILFLWNLVGVGFGQAASPSCEPEHLFSPAEMRSDLAEWRSILESEHPTFYRFTTPEEMATEFDHVSNALDHPMNQLGFLKTVSPILSFIKDGHAALNPTGACRRFIHQQAKQFPLQLRFSANRAYIVRSVSSGAPVGAEVLSINGKPLPEVQEAIQSRLSRDGNIPTGLEIKLSEFFPYLYYLYIDQPDVFVVAIRYKGRQENVRLSALSETEIKSQSFGMRDDSNDPPLAYRDLGNGVALLRISSFAESDMTDANQNFAAFMEQSFSSVRRESIHDLVIDLRSNSGGDNYGPLLFSYLHRGPFPYFKDYEARTNDLSNLTPLRDHPVSPEWTEFVAHFHESLTQTAQGDFHATIATYPDLGIQQGQADPYEGKVWFLVDGGTFSATGWFCSIARSYGRGIFVGEETGGDYYGNTGVEAIGFPLKNTRLPFTVALLRVVLAVRDGTPQDRGVRPDLPYRAPVERTPGRDPELDFVLNAISHASKR